MSRISDDIKTIKRELIITNAAIIILGLLMAIFPETSGNIICLVVGAILAVFGLISIIMYFMNERTQVLSSFALVRGTALIGFGVYFLIKPEILAAILTVILAIVLLVGGVMKLQYAFDFFRLKSTIWWVELIGAVLMIALGVVVFVDPFTAVKGLMLFLGISLVFDGIWDLISILYLSKVASDVKKEMQKTIPDSSDFVDTTAETKE